MRPKISPGYIDVAHVGDDHTLEISLIVLFVHKIILQSEKINTDDTPVPVPLPDVPWSSNASDNRCPWVDFLVLLCPRSYNHTCMWKVNLSPIIPMTATFANDDRLRR